MRSEKTTDAAGLGASRRYDDACGTAHALELFGDRWALLVMRELMLGARRFSQLRADLPGVSANVLSQRLGELTARGLVVRKKLPPPAAVQIYDLTPWGREAQPIVQAMGRWAARSPFHDPTLRISGVSLLLSFGTMLDGGRARGIDAEIGFRFGDDVYRGHLTADSFPIGQRDPDGADVIFVGEPVALGAAVYGGVTLGALQKDGALMVVGDLKLARRFTTLFPLPNKASA